MRIRGQSMVHLMIAFAVAVPVLLVLLDLASLWYDGQANDALCKDAARAAASGDPSSAQQRAKSVVDLKNKTGKGPLVKRFVVVQCVELKAGGHAGLPSDGSQSGAVTGGAAIASTTQGAIEVTTEAQVKPMVVHLTCGLSSPMVLRSVQSCPISYTQPAP